MEEQKNVTNMGGSMRLGAYDCMLKEGSKVLEAYGKEHIQERHRHRFEFNNEYKKQYEAAGMMCTGENPETNLVEVVEIPALKWFVGVQYHPEYNSTVVNPNPLFLSFVKAAIENKKIIGDKWIKNTLIGFLLIGVVLFAFSWFNRPTPEQLEAQRRYQDSIAKIEYAQQLELQKQENKSAFSGGFVGEPAGLGTGATFAAELRRIRRRYGGHGRLHDPANDVVELRISNKGGRICYARLKEYDTYNDEPLVLFDEKESNFNFTLVTATNRVVNTSDLYFTPVKGNDPNSVIMRLNTGEGSHLILPIP